MLELAIAEGIDGTTAFPQSPGRHSYQPIG
jgi:hypothetical protein